MSTRGSGSPNRSRTSLPSSFTLSPGPTESPSFAAWPFTVTWPCAIRISMLRREPYPDCAITFCRRSRLEPPAPPPLPPFPPLAARRRLLGSPWGRAHSGTTPPGQSSLGVFKLRLSRMGLLRGLGVGVLVDPRVLFGLGRRGRRVGFEEGLGGRLERGLQLVERRKFLERPQVQVVEELARGGEDRGTAGRLAVSDHLDPCAFHQGVDGGRGDRDTADLLDVAARNRLAVRDDREGLQHRARIPRRLLLDDAVEEFLVIRLHPEAPAGGHRGELDRAAAPLELQLLEHLADVVRVDLAAEEALQLLDR